MKIRGDEPFFGLKSLCKNVWNTWNWKLKVIVYFRKVFLLSKFKYLCFVTILDMSLISRSCKNDHIIFNVGTPSLEVRNIRLVNIITYIIEESKLISENMSPNVIIAISKTCLKSLQNTNIWILTEEKLCGNKQ
jgi:hypothetical protein